MYENKTCYASRVRFYILYHSSTCFHYEYGCDRVKTAPHWLRKWDDTVERVAVECKSELCLEAWGYEFLNINMGDVYPFTTISEPQSLPSCVILPTSNAGTMEVLFVRGFPHYPETMQYLDGRMGSG